jgi:hypothetical protein
MTNRFKNSPAYAVHHYSPESGDYSLIPVLYNQQYYVVITDY